MKRALTGYLVYCSYHAMRAENNAADKKWDDEIDETNKLLDAVEINLRRLPQDVLLTPAKSVQNSNLPALTGN